MAIHLLQTKMKPLSILLSTYIYIACLFLLLASKVNSQQVLLAFNITSFQPVQPEIILQGDAQISPGVLKLTKTASGSVGRALYSAPLRLWHLRPIREIGETSFLTSFTFVVRSPTQSPADGIAFFLAPLDSEIQTNGGYLGLFNSRVYNSSQATVAVEFDSWTNNWDPPNHRYHIGVDVNSIESTKTVPWNRREGEIAKVYIGYSAFCRQLGVILEYPNSTPRIRHELFDVVDLQRLLPQWVRIGFSATTGLSEADIETHDVLSWDFIALDHNAKITSTDASTVEEYRNLVAMFKDHAPACCHGFSNKLKDSY